MKTSKNTLFLFVTGLALLLQLLNPTLVRAEGEPPTAPADSTTEVAPATEPAPLLAETATDVVPTEPAPLPAAAATVVLPAETATEAAPTEPAPLATEDPVGVPTAAPETAPTATLAAETEPPALETVFQDLPAGTDVLVLDETGQPLSLATQAAEAVIATADPVWCPSSLAAPTPGLNGCTASYASLGTLLASEVAYIDAQTVDGTIWITSGAIAETGAISIDGASYTNWDNYGLTLQGGWSGASGDPKIGANSVFSVPILIAHWTAPITINNLTLQSVPQSKFFLGKDAALFLEDVGDVHLNNFQSKNNSSIWASVHIETRTNSTVTIAQSVFSMVSGYANRGLRLQGPDYVSITDTSFIGEGLDLDYAGGFASGNGSVTLDRVTATGHFSNGVKITSWGDVLIKDSEMNSNGQVGLWVDNWRGGHDPKIHDPIDITIINSTFNSNMAGIHAFAGRDLTLNNVSASNNDRSGWFPAGWRNGISGLAGRNIIVNGGIYSANNNNGLGLYAPNGTIFFNRVTSSGNGAGDISTDAQSVTYVESLKSILPLFEPVLKIVAGQNQLDFALDCRHRKIYPVDLPNGDRVQVVCPVTGTARITRLDNTTLPAGLPPGYLYAAALALEIFQDDQPIPVIREGGGVEVSFQVADLQAGKTYSILYWDDQTGKWIPLKDFMFAPPNQSRAFSLFPGDPADTRQLTQGVRLVTSPEGARLVVSVNFPGVFVLAQD